MTPTRILFVCMGNICRSPTAEGVMRALLREEGVEGVEVDSAGIGDWHVGDAPDRRSTAAARQRGIVLDGAARQVRASDFEDFDLLIAMDRANRRDLLALAPDAEAAAKVRLLREWEPGASDLDVPDPYYGDGRGFEDVLDMVQASCRALLAELLTDAVRAATGRAVTRVERVGGGDINEAFRVELEGGARAFVKTRADAAPGEYETEAEGLRWLAETGGLPVPDVLGAGADVLVLEWVEPGRRGDEAGFGRGLALVHQAGAHAFGGPRPLRIGALELPNEPAPDWATFYAERRLRPLLHALPASGARVLERVCERVSEFIGDPEPPARLHGDLWTGNVHWGADGRPWLIDPAAYGGHREVDLAMLRLFGSPGADFLAAYEDVTPLAEGHAERVGLWQLFPLLVHAALFGGGYGARAEQVARQYL